jgi:hypothetical protein
MGQAAMDYQEVEMAESLRNFAVPLMLALACGIGAYILKTYKNSVLAIILNLVKEAESAINGSKMGEEKKAKVIAQLESAGIKVTNWVSKEIDNVVAHLNENAGWFIKSAETTSLEKNSTPVLNTAAISRDNVDVK